MHSLKSSRACKIAFAVAPESTNSMQISRSLVTSASCYREIGALIWVWPGKGIDWFVGADLFCESMEYGILRVQIGIAKISGDFGADF